MGESGNYITEILHCSQKVLKPTVAEPLLSMVNQSSDYSNARQPLS